MLRLGYYFIPLWVFFFINMTLSILTYIKLKHLGLPEQILNNFKKIVLFPLILFFTGIFGTVDLIYNYVHQKELIWLNDTGLLILSLYGFFNAIVYFLTNSGLWIKSIDQRENKNILSKREQSNV